MDIQIITENGERKNHHIPEMETIVGCSCCGHIFRARDAKATLVQSNHFEKWARIWNPKYISPTEYMVFEEGQGYVKKTVNHTVDQVFNEDGFLECAAVVSENPEPKFLHVRVDSKKVEYTCNDCLSKPVYMGVKEMPVTATNVLKITDQIRALRKTHGARLVMLGFGRKIDSAVEMCCQQMRVKFQEAQQ